MGVGVEERQVTSARLSNLGIPSTSQQVGVGQGIAESGIVELLH